MTRSMAASPAARARSARDGDWPRDLLSTLAASADGVYAVDSKQRIVFWSDSAQQLTGLSAEEAVGRSCYKVMVGGDYEGNPFCRRNCPTIVSARRGRSVPSYDLQVTAADGRPAWFNMSIIPLRRRGAGRTLAVHMFRDVTSRRRAEMLAQATLETVSRFTEAEGKPAAPEQPYPAPAPTLTGRELEVLRLLARGLGTAQIGDRLGVAPATVRNHIDHLLAKLGAHRRLEAVVRARELGLI